MLHVIRENLLNKVYGYLKVEKYLGLRTKRKDSADVWLCRCSCNTTVKLTSNELINCGRKSCGCKKVETLKTTARSYNYKGIGDISGTWWLSLRKDAKRRGIKVKITLKYVAKLWEKQKGRCAISGLTIDATSAGLRGTASLDRIDNSKGYLYGNVWWVHKDINKMKNIHNLDYFISLCRTVTKYQEQNDETDTC